MKTILISALCLIPFLGFSQKLTEYKAPNGKTYHVGDTVKVGMGSMANGDFKYIQINTPLSFLPQHRNSNSLNATKDFSLSNAIIKKIKAEKQMSGSDKIIITVKTNGIPTFDIWIIEAIAACEVTPCASSATPNKAASGSVADELIKLKKLLDEGAINKDEYNAQKKKLLSE